MFLLEDVIPLAALTPTVLGIFLTTPDAIDKLIKGLGSLFRLTSLVLGLSTYGKLAGKCSQIRSGIRMAKWYEKLGAVDKATSTADWINVRNILFIFRVIFDALYIFLDNVSFLGLFLSKENQTLLYFTQVARASLFWGFAFAMLLELYDAFCVAKEKRQFRTLKITQNALELLSGLSSVCRAELGAVNVALMVAASSAISIREQLLIAQKKDAKKKI